MAKSRGLGKSIFDTFDDNLIESKKGAGEMLRISAIEPRHDQPRKTFDRESLEALAESVQKYGVLQPIIVRPNQLIDDTYEIIAGERRWRAAKLAGLDEIPAVILDGDDLKIAQVAIIENIQREDLNAVEEALAYQGLMDRFGLTQDQVSKQVGKSRSAVANLLRLLDLPEEVLVMLKNDEISAGHARALLALNSEEDMVALAGKIVEKQLSVREVESAVKRLNTVVEIEEIDDADAVNATVMTKIHLRELEKRTRETLGRKVKIVNNAKKRVVEITFDSDEDLETLLSRVCGA
ncbi:MAG: ParB/RepB/Spo0J family partition protein, partial [Clostridia bacterium]|nr:ParB/RepB/Spo0J family partition protein [Clostridia bacterium]